MPSKKQMYLILVALSFLVYSNCLTNAFISDDIPGILKNPDISRAWGFWLQPSAFLNSLNYLIAKFNPFAYHLTNVILHTFNTILVFLFLQLWFSPSASFLSSGLFAVHPIHTEAVTWISGRPYLITAAFILIVYLLYYRATPQAQLNKEKAVAAKSSVQFHSGYYFLSLAIFSYYVLSSFSFFFIFPFFLIFSDLTFKRWRKNWKLWLPFLALAVLSIILARGGIAHRILYVAKEAGHSSSTWSNPVFNMAYSIFYHTGLLLWPAKLTLYHEPSVITPFALTCELIILGVLILASWLIYKKAREVYFALGIFVLFLAPSYSPIQVSWLVAERYLYFPSVALSICAAFIYERFSALSSVKKNADLTTPPLERLRQKSKNYWVFLLIAVMGLYVVRTIARNEDWKTQERFWRQTVEVSSLSPRAHNNMGDVYFQEENFKRAIDEFKRALELRPDYPEVYHNLANTYQHIGNLKEAITLYERAITLNPQLFESLYNLGVIYINSGAVDLAIDRLSKAAKLRPDNAEVQTTLNFALSKRPGK